MHCMTEPKPKGLVAHPEKIRVGERTSSLLHIKRRYFMWNNYNATYCEINYIFRFIVFICGEKSIRYFIYLAMVKAVLVCKILSAQKFCLTRSLDPTCLNGYKNKILLIAAQIFSLSPYIYFKRNNSFIDNCSW